MRVVDLTDNLTYDADVEYLINASNPNHDELNRLKWSVVKLTELVGYLIESKELSNKEIIDLIGCESKFKLR